MGSAEDYFMAGRSFGTLVLFMSLFGTNVTAFALVSMPGISYHAGIGAFGFFGAVAAFVTPLCFILMGYPIWVLGKRHGYMTQPHMFSDRWQSPAVGYLLFAVLIFYTIPYLIIGLMGGGITIEAISGGVVPYALAAGIVAVVTLLYTSLGGMRGTAWTNVFQASIFLLFLGVACWGIATKLGGFQVLNERLVNEAPHLLGKQHPRLAPGIWASGFLIGPRYCLPTYLYAPDDSRQRKGAQTNHFSLSAGAGVTLHSDHFDWRLGRFGYARSDWQRIG